MKAYLKHYQQRIEKILENTIERTGYADGTLQEAMCYSTLNGGKRLRAMLVYVTGEMFGVHLNLLDKPAAAVELIHAYSLIHDDLPAMDNDDLRRGKPSCHKAFNEALAILAGDALQSLAFELLSSDKEPALSIQQRMHIIYQLAKAIGYKGMVKGQALDLAAENKQISLSALQTIHKLKTGALISSSVLVGAMAVKDLPQKCFKALELFAEYMGLAYQIRDDILDVASSTQIMGKIQGSDQDKNKPTYASILGIESANQIAMSLYDQALSHLQGLDENTDKLLDLASMMIHRQF